MQHTSCKNLRSIFWLLAALIAVLPLIAVACNPTIEPPPAPPAAISLLQIEPYIGDETEIRDPAPETIRMVRAEESVEGRLMPIECKMRFPVELREGARFSACIGAETTVSIRIGDLGLRIEYLPETPIQTEEGEIEGPIVVYQTTPEASQDMFTAWHEVDVSLRRCGVGKGELVFILEGDLAGNPGIRILWGRPTIHHPPERRFKNVLLIGVDTLRADALTPYGADPAFTPNLQKLSETATVFTQARAQCSWTLPSFASMLTGRLPSSINSTLYTGHLPAQPTTIAEHLRLNGYATYAVCSNAWLGNPQSGFHQGFEALWFRTDAVAQLSVTKAMEFIDRSRDRDWFCFIHFMDPHSPYSPSEELAELFTDPAYEGPIGNEFGFNEVWKSGDFVPPPEDVKHVRALYDAEVANLDAALGDLFEHLDGIGLTENTLVIFASDHGEEFFEHGGFEHGHTHYEELIWMPLIVGGAGFPPGSRIDTPVGNTDIFPSILDYIDLAMTDGLVGVPLQDVAVGEVDEDRLIFGEGNTRGTFRKYAIEWPYKCIVDYVKNEARLYNLETDPGEFNDISAEHVDLVSRLAGEVVMAMLPEETAFHLWITRGYGEAPARFTGTVRVPGGIIKVFPFQLTEHDEYVVEGDTITFDITSAIEKLGPNKHLLILPAEGAYTLEASVRVNGRVQPDRFYPYGTRSPEPTGSATISIDDFPLGLNLPLAFEALPASCYIWAVRGHDQTEDAAELDTETIEQLRALGYLNDWIHR